MPQIDPSEYDFSNERVNLAVFDAGQFDATSIDQNDVGEIASLEFGETGYGPLSEYFYMALGGIENSDNPYALDAKVYGDLNSDEADTASASGTQLRIRVVNQSKDRTIVKTPWYDKKALEGSAENNPRLVFGTSRASMAKRIDRATWVREGRYVLIEVRNQQQATTVDISGSNLSFPFFGAN